MSDSYEVRIFSGIEAVSASAWNALLAAHPSADALNPFMRHEYLLAMQQSGSATPATGWTLQCITLWHDDVLVGACALYLKAHSYGEYVFDMAWAQAYAQHGLRYYPKAVIGVPFTPVPGPRLLADSEATRLRLALALMAWCKTHKLSSIHLLFGADEDLAACEQAGWMLRQGVQFHWKNITPTHSDACDVPADEEAVQGMELPSSVDRGAQPSPRKFRDFEDFLMSLSQAKRKKIRQERRKVQEAGVTFRWAAGKDISTVDWDFFYRCYERTYLEHGNAPYLSRDFFTRMQHTMPENWLLFVAEQTVRGQTQAIATSLIALSAYQACPTGLFNDESEAENTPSQSVETPLQTAYGRYWGALARVDCLHFEACYYQPLAWCIAHGYDVFEGGAQGEHKMARALLPVKTASAHWLAHPAFADAVGDFLQREDEGMAAYVHSLEARSPFKQA